MDLQTFLPVVEQVASKVMEEQPYKQQYSGPHWPAAFFLSLILIQYLYQPFASNRITA